MLTELPTIDNKTPMTEEQVAGFVAQLPQPAFDVEAAKKYVNELELPAPPKPKRKPQPFYTLTAADYRPFIHKHLLKGGMIAGELEMLAEKHFKDRFTAGDLAPVISKDGRQQFPQKWRHRFKCAAEAMRKSGILHHPGTHKQRAPGYWILTPKGMESKNGY